MKIEDELRNWGRAMCDQWLESHLDINEAPAWRQYVSGKSFDDPEEPDEPIDEIAAGKTESIVIRIGKTDIDAMTALILRYCHPELSQLQRVKRLRTTRNGFRRILKRAEEKYRRLR